MNFSKTVAAYISKHHQDKTALNLLRELILSTQLKETIKWGSPVYTLENKNVVGIGAFKSYVGLWFFQGALLKDEKKKLVNAQEGVTKALRQWRFNSIEEIRRETDTIKAYLEEAIANQKQGKKIKPARSKPLTIPNELKELFTNNPKLKQSFESFSLSKRREFAEYITEAKRPETKQKRLEKIRLLILSGRGLNEKNK